MRSPPHPQLPERTLPPDSLSAQVQRLSTIRDADVIYVVKDGCVTEAGTHDELMADPTGLYRSLALAQGIMEEVDENATAPA